jgi:hypothetical protein
MAVRAASPHPHGVNRLGRSKLTRATTSQAIAQGLTGGIGYKVESKRAGASHAREVRATCAVPNGAPEHD